MNLLPRCVTGLGIAVLLVGWRTGAAGQTASITADSMAKRVAAGKILFHGKGLCFSCHGRDGDGMLGPSTRLAGRPMAHTKPTLPDIVSLIKAGVDSAHSTLGQPMPPRGGSRLSDTEVESVAWYVLSLQKSRPPS